MIKISPSILSADFGRLAEEVRALVTGGCDYVHVDVMDGRFVPNITIGQPVVAAVKAASQAPLDVHLMIDEPERYVESFVAAGASIVTIHVEACRHLHRTLAAIREQGAKAGVTLNPATPLETVRWVLEEIDLVLVMSVNPGFGGQRFIPAALERVAILRQMIDERGLEVEIEVDGGVVVDNAGALAAAGADVLVSGSGVFGAPGGDYKRRIAEMRAAAEAGRGQAC